MVVSCITLDQLIFLSSDGSRRVKARWNTVISIVDRSFHPEDFSYSQHADSHHSGSTRIPPLPRLRVTSPALPAVSLSPCVTAHPPFGLAPHLAEFKTENPNAGNSSQRFGFPSTLNSKSQPTTSSSPSHPPWSTRTSSPSSSHPSRFKYFIVYALLGGWWLSVLAPAVGSGSPLSRGLVLLSWVLLSRMQFFSVLSESHVECVELRRKARTKTRRSKVTDLRR